MRRLVTSLAAAVALALLLGACSLPGSGPDPEDALKRLAAALSSGSVKGVDFTDDATAVKAYATLTDGVSGLGRPKVAAGTVSAKDGTATGKLAWTWAVGTKTWSYATTVSLTKGTAGGEDAWLVKWSPTLVEPTLRTGETLGQSTLKAARGSILGAGDRPIVEPRPVLRVGLDKIALLSASETTSSATALARLIGIEAPAFVKQAVAAGPKAFVEGIVYRRSEVPGSVLAGLGRIPGARAISDELPLAPSKDFASAILGTVGPATAEIVKESKGRIRAGDDVGLSGLQKRYDEQLAGTRGVKVVAVDERGVRRTLFTVDPVPGKPLRTTLDLASQQVAQQALSGVGPASALVAIRPSTGALVAVASGPGSQGYNTATLGRYAPGSTFKIVSSLALLRAGVTPTTSVTCPATTVVDGKTFKNYSDYPASGLGRIRFEDAFANSCNTAFIGERAQLTGDDLGQAAAALGLGVDHDTGFPSYFGQVGTPASETQAAASMIGQGTVLASPMAMATVVASVIKGATVLPRLLTDQRPDPKAPAAPLTATEAQQLRTLMRGVVLRGSGALLQDVPGGPVIAKTGTAEYGTKPPLPTHAWMVAGHGDLAVAVFVERGASGSGTAGPLLKQFLDKVR